MIYKYILNGFPANTTRWNNDVSMLAQRLRRWPNIKTSLFQPVVFAGLGYSLLVKDTSHVFVQWHIQLY